MISRVPAVLFVDDEHGVLAAIRRTVRREPFRKFFAGTAEEALNILRNNDISVMVTDLRMPGMDGLELIRRAKEHNPRLMCIILTASYDAKTIKEALDRGEIYAVIRKPWNRQQLISCVREALPESTS